MSSPVLREFPYRLNPIPSIVLLLVMGCCATGLFLYFAICRLSQVVVLGNIEMTPTQVQLVMGTLAALTLMGTIFAVRRTLANPESAGRIALTADSIILPKPNEWGTAWGEEEMELPLDDVISAEVVPFVGYAVQLRITYSGGQVGIPSNMLPTRRDFNLLSQLLSAAIDNRLSAALAERYMSGCATASPAW
jgi:hypothetical protein